ncbi:MAG: SIMPL domain-containing protein [Anaerolineales bacterium]|nr:SIMPL domain-containing protein [Anaerolineales bacterium]MCX7607781.1 SIMPL domain-containing protein [Anaerolineales bacterium]MDW8227556.1 SIMPL domain-containing protein [Anaerolineales bacterium]
MRTKLLVFILVLMLGGVLSACGPTTIYTQPEPPARTITVSGTGMVTLTPDVAYVYIGVQTQDASATKAMDDNNARAQAVIEAIKSFGVKNEDIKTTNFSIYPQPVYDENYNQVGVTYVVNNTVYVTVRDLDKLGALLDASFRAGANTIHSISFDVADKTNAISQARLAAVENARRQAEELAKATGVEIGKVQTITYYDSTPSPVYYARMDAKAEGVPIEVGSMQIVTTVTIVYEIK